MLLSSRSYEIPRPARPVASARLIASARPAVTDANAGNAADLQQTYCSGNIAFAELLLKTSLY